MSGATRTHDGMKLSPDIRVFVPEEKWTVLIRGPFAWVGEVHGWALVEGQGDEIFPVVHGGERLYAPWQDGVLVPFLENEEDGYYLMPIDDPLQEYLDARRQALFTKLDERPARGFRRRARRSA